MENLVGVEEVVELANASRLPANQEESEAMKAEGYTALKERINLFIWQNAIGTMTLDDAEEIACEFIKKIDPTYDHY